MAHKRQFSLGIWWFALGYFGFYIPYSALVKAITNGAIPGMPKLSGLELLPATIIPAALTMVLFITLKGWWKYPDRRSLFGVSVPVPRRSTALSGLGFALIIGTTTLAYTFEGISIVFALLLLRGGVLVIAPIVDTLFRRRVRWFSWMALGLSLTALAIAFSDIGNYTMSIAAALNVVAYLTGYLVRLPCMTRTAKSSKKEVTYRYFVEEQLVAMPTLVLVPAFFALWGATDAMLQLRSGFVTLLSGEAAAPALIVGILYACLSVCGTMIYLDRRENTFCIPLNRCSSLLSGVVASFALSFLVGLAPPSPLQLVGAALVIVAVLSLSPLHHLSDRQPEVSPLTRLRGTYLFVCGGNTFRSPLAQAVCRSEIARILGIDPGRLEQQGITILSAGVSAKPGDPLDTNGAQALEKLGVPLSHHTAQQLTPSSIHRADSIYCVTESVRRDVIRMAPEAEAKTYLLGPESDLGDHRGPDAHQALEVAERLQQLVSEMLRHRKPCYGAIGVAS